MNNNLQNIATDLQEKDFIANTLERIDEINALVNQKTIPQGYEVDKEGVWFIQEKKDSAPTREWLSSPLLITCYTRDHKNENHGRVLEFQDIDGHKHIWIMPMELLAGESSKILAALLNMGLKISPKRQVKEKLLEYISQCNPVHKARCVSQCGWYKGAFVLPLQTIGYIQSEKIIYQNPFATELKMDTKGSLEEWQNKIAIMAIGNSRLLLSISAGFAGPLLEPMNHENIGIHFRGNSSLGKSTALHVGNSVWESAASIRTYRATANGLEGIAAQHNDRMLCLDELSQCPPQEAGQVVYMLGNGIGKGRASQQGLPRKQSNWHLIFLSNGEIGLAQLLAEIKRKIKAGQEVRLVEIPADTGIYGLFENLNGFEDGADFSTYLKDTCAQYYGTAAKAFLQKLVEDIEGAIDFVKTVINGLKQKYLPKNSSSQVIRVFNHLSLIAGAGELASNFGITGWEIGVAADGVMKCFQDWLQARGGIGMQEEQAALNQVKTFFEQHGESRFSSWTSDPIDESKTINRVGFRRRSEEGEVEFYVFPNAFRDEICSGLDYKYVENLCIKENLLIPSSDNSPTRSERLPGFNNKTKRCYRFSSKVIS